MGSHKNITEIVIKSVLNKLEGASKAVVPKEIMSAKRKDVLNN